MLDFVYKGNAYSLFYSKTNDEVPVVDIKGCQLENKNSLDSGVLSGLKEKRW